MERKPTAYIPVEIKRRELTSQVILAKFLADSGFRIYIGTHAAINNLLSNKSFVGGVYLDKSVPVYEKLIRVRSKVDYVGVLDQELSPVVSYVKQDQNGEGFLRNLFTDRVPEACVDQVDFFVTLGEPYTSHARKIFGNNKVLEFGWPRFDLLHEKYRILFEREIKSIRGALGSFALYVSNFQYIGDLEKMRNSKHRSTLLINSYTITDYEMDQVDFRNTMKVLNNWMSLESNTISLIIRPHPGEDVRIFRNTMNKTKQYRINKTGEIFPWLLACEFVLHRGSTSSVQAIFAEKPTFFIEDGDSGDRFRVTKDLSNGVLRDGELITNPIVDTQKNRLLLRERVRNFGYSTEILSEYLHNLDCTPEPAYGVRTMLRGYFSVRALKRSLGLLRDELQFFFGRLSVLPQSRFVHFGIRKSEITATLQKLDVSKDLRVISCGINLIRIERQ